MNALDSLATTALLGTDRRPPDWPVLDGPIGELLARIPREAPEKALLQMAGVLGTCQVAGVLPAQHPHAPTLATEDAKAQDPRVDLIAAILADGPERLQAEAFRRVAAAGAQLPHRLLPKALDCGRRSTALRPSLLPILGRRGEWLAAQNEAWGYAAGSGGESASSDDAWQHGSLDQRRLYLAALRIQDSAKARELVREAMTTEGAKERTAFIECLTTGLTLADEELLDATLADKSKEARQVAARLLSCMPDSRFARRMGAYLTPYLKLEKFLRGTIVELEAPLAFDPAWKSNLIEEVKPKGMSMGDRAWWLLQLIRQTPLSWWETQTSMTPAECLAWAQKSDWKDALLQGWAEAQSVQRRVEWAQAFLDTSLLPIGPLTVFDLIETLPPALRETHFQRLLTSTDMKLVPAGAVLDRLIKALPLDAPILSAATASQLVALLKQRVHSGESRSDWQLRTALVELACVLPATALNELANNWDFTNQETQPFAEAVARIGTVQDLRRQIST